MSQIQTFIKADVVIQFLRTVVTSFMCTIVDLEYVKINQTLKMYPLGLINLKI